ncbi:MAG: c-type cytochrome biogenesis protein CcmI [Pseudomonadota bacterium]
MIFWIAVTAMVIPVVWLLIRSLGQHQEDEEERAPSTPDQQDLAVYRDQLDEVERDLGRGLIDADQAAAASREIKRRILEADAREQSSLGQQSGTSNRLTAMGLAICSPLAALGLYLWLGTPGLPGLPYADRQDGLPVDSASQLAMISQIETQLETNPENQEAWLTLGHLYRLTQNLEGAAGAYRRALIIAPDWVQARTSLAETLIAQGGGSVTQEARRLFAQVLESDPNNPSALYYAGLAMAQDGYLREAISAWLTLLRASPEGSPWIPAVAQQVQDAAVALNLDPTTLQPRDDGTATGQSAPDPFDGTSPGLSSGTAPSMAPSLAPSRGPSAEDMATAAEMSTEERAAFIQSMVDQLASRLEEDPENLQGWLRLANAYRVLGQPEKMGAALASAEKLVADLPKGHPDRQLVESAKNSLSEK